MKNIVYRNLEKGDYLQVKRLINSVWKFERFSNDAKTAENLLELYTRKTLIEQNYAKVAVCEDEIVGLLFASKKGGKRLSEKLVHVPSIMLKKLSLLFTPKENKEVANEYKKMISAYEELLDENGETYDGEMILFLVDVEYQGHGIGKTLMNDFFAVCKRSDMKKICLYTDTECSFGYYDKNGFQRKNTGYTEFDTVEGTEKVDVFLYTYKFN